MPVGFAARHELTLQLLQYRHLLLAHRLTQFVALAAGEVRQQTREEHDLLLIDRNAVGVFQVFLHHGDVVGNGLQALLAADELRDVVHRSRAVEGVHRDDVAYHRRLQLLHILAHTRRLKLEDARRLPFLEEFVGQCVVNGDMVDVHHLARALLDVLDAFLDDIQRDKPEEVHLDKPYALHHVSVVLGYEHALLQLRVIDARQRCELRQVVRADDDAAGVDTYLAIGVLQLLGVLQHLAHIRLAHLKLVLQLVHVLVAVLQVHFRALAFLVLDVVGEIAVGDIRFQFCHLRQRQSLHAPHVGYRALGCHLAVGYDMRHMRLAVALRHPIDDLRTPHIIEVGVYIRQRDTVGVEETLEQQVVLQRVKVGDMQTIGYHAARRATATGTHAHA